MFVPEYMPRSATRTKRLIPRSPAASSIAGLSVWWSSVFPGKVAKEIGMPLPSRKSPSCTIGCLRLSLLTPNFLSPATAFPSASSKSSSGLAASKKKFVTS